MSRRAWGRVWVRETWSQKTTTLPMSYASGVLHVPFLSCHHLDGRSVSRPQSSVFRDGTRSTVCRGGWGSACQALLSPPAKTPATRSLLGEPLEAVRRLIPTGQCGVQMGPSGRVDDRALSGFPRRRTLTVPWRVHVYSFESGVL